MALRSSAAPARPTQVASGPTIGLRSVLDSLSNLCSISWFGGDLARPRGGPADRGAAGAVRGAARRRPCHRSRAGRQDRAVCPRRWHQDLESHAAGAAAPTRGVRPAPGPVTSTADRPRPSIPSTPARLRDLAGQSVIGARERPPLIIWRCANNKDQTVAAGPSIAPTRWQQTLDELLGRIAGHFARVEPRRRAAAFVCGLLAELPRKNCWTLAEHAGDPTPDGMQHLLSGAVWDEHAVRDDVRDYVVEHLGDPQGCWWWTRAGTARRARPRWGGSPVHRHQRQGRQRPGRGLPGLRQPGRHAVVDRELYVPRGWIADRDRRAAAGVPEQLGFGTKPEWPG